MTLHLASQRMLLPTTQVDTLTTGSISLPSARQQATAIPFQAFESIATASGSGTTYTFSNIPDKFTHLELHMTGRDGGSGSGTDWVQFQLNDDTSASYYMYGIYGTPLSGSLGPTYAIANGDGYFARISQGGTTANGVSAAIVRFYNCSDPDRATTFQSVSSADVNSSSAGDFYMMAGYWAKKQVVNKIKLYFLGAQTFDALTHVELYGIRAEW